MNKEKDMGFISCITMKKKHYQLVESQALVLNNRPEHFLQDIMAVIVWILE